MYPGMNAEAFLYTPNYYFRQFLNLIVYSYEQIKKDKSAHHARGAIHSIIIDVRKSKNSNNEIEDFLRHHMVTGYLRKYQRKFKLEEFVIESGVEEFKKNVKVGIVDIKIIPTPANNVVQNSIIFECKRINKELINAYIENGMMRFVRRQYYAESEMSTAGMIGFVEVDLSKNPKGYRPIADVANLLQDQINAQRELLKTTEEFSRFPLYHDEYREVADFKHSYISRHIRDEDNQEISIHHLLLDYHEILK